MPTQTIRLRSKMCGTGPGFPSNGGTAGSASDTAGGSAAANRFVFGMPLNHRRRASPALGILSTQAAGGAAVFRPVKLLSNVTEDERTSGPVSSRSNRSPDPTQPLATVLARPVPGRGPASFCFTDARPLGWADGALPRLGSAEAARADVRTEIRTGARTVMTSTSRPVTSCGCRLHVEPRPRAPSLLFSVVGFRSIQCMRLTTGYGPCRGPGPLTLAFNQRKS